MHATLFEAADECRSPGEFYERVLAPWSEPNVALRDALQAFAETPGDSVPPASIEDRWALFGLSCANDVLLLPFQPRVAGEDSWAGPTLSLTEYAVFARSLGFRIETPATFSPFHHEIVSVEQADDENQPIAIRRVEWPRLMLGDMLFSRAGVRVSGGRNFVQSGVAERSTLYWTNRRNHRPTNDLSHGWGSNSRWRTPFRRDYIINGVFHLNVDADRTPDCYHDLNSPAPLHDDSDGLTRAERIELLVHRSFITSQKPHDDLWPYNDTYTTPVPSR